MGLALATAGLAVAAAALLFGLRGERSALLAAGRELGVDSADLERKILRAEDPEVARTALAKALLAAALEADPDDARAAAQRGPRLEEAVRLARVVLARRPAAWDAATVAGAATYVGWSLERDPRLLQEYRSWEEPLLLARRLAPAQPEPMRYLATAYLELWPALSEDKRELTRELLADAFRNPVTFGQLVGPWLAASGGDLDPVPDLPWAWTGLQDAFAATSDWRGYCEAWESGRRALRSRLDAQVEDARRMLRAGKLLNARRMLFGAVASAPADRDFSALVERALETAPHGPARPELRRSLAQWLHWAFDLAPGDDRPLSPGALGRMRALVTGDGAGTQENLAAAAWTHLTAGDLAAAESVEARSELLSSEPWALYWIEKARFRVGRDELPQAREALGLVHADWQDAPAYWLARQLAAKAAGELEEVAEVEAALDRLAADPWPGLAWSWKRGRVRLAPLVASPSERLSVNLGEVSETGAAVALRWNGEVLGCYPAAAGGAVTLSLPIERGLHLLEVETLAGSRVWPAWASVRPVPQR